MNKNNEMEKNDTHYIRFDWAAKHILRDKADFSVFEGFLMVLLKERVKIVELLESESNQQNDDDKFNRVDIKAKNSNGEIILVEIQQSEEYYYLQRMVYGVAKTITEHITKGKQYSDVKKVYSVNIVYLDLGEGSDYLYHGQNRLIGMNTGDELQITEEDRNGIRILSPKHVFPEYYILRVKAFNKEPENAMDEWMDYLKNERIRQDTAVPGLQEAKRRLDYLKMTVAEQKIYDNYLYNKFYREDVLNTSRTKGVVEGFHEGKEEGLQEGLEKGLEKGRAEGRAEGLHEGLEKGRAEGRAEKRIAIAANMKRLGIPEEQISQSTGIPVEEIKM